jgi:hypothetical protein
MKHVGGCHPHGINVIRFDGFAPISDGPLEPKVVHRAFATLFLCVSTDNQDGVEGTVGEEGGNTEHRATVRLPHPAQAQHGNTDATIHGYFTFRGLAAEISAARNVVFWVVRGVMRVVMVW